MLRYAVLPFALLLFLTACSADEVGPIDCTMVVCADEDAGGGGGGDDAGPGGGGDDAGPGGGGDDAGPGGVDAGDGVDAGGGDPDAGPGDPDAGPSRCRPVPRVGDMPCRAGTCECERDRECYDVGEARTCCEGPIRCSSPVPSCMGTHPNVSGTMRTCNPGFCYCANPDACFPRATAMMCCAVPVVCASSTP